MAEKYIPDIPTPPEKRKLLREALFGFLGIEDSTEDQQQVEKAIEVLREEIEKTPKVGRIIEQNKALRNEFVIPLTSREQGDKIREHLFDLGIFPWEEDGLMIIDRKNDLEKLQLAGLIRGTSYQETKEDQPISGGIDIDEKLYRFPLPEPAPKERKRIRKEEPQPVAEESLEPGIDTELVEMIQKFDAGLVDDDEEEFRASFGEMPTLTLFPHKYIRKNNRTIHARTGEVITEEKEAAILRKAQEGDPKALNEYVRLHVGFVIYIAKRVKDRFGGDIDEIFQDGLVGLEYAIRHYTAEEGAKFTSYAGKCIEGYMRSGLRKGQYDITLPVNTGRSKVRRLRNVEDKKKQLLGAQYEEDLDTRDYLENLSRLERRLLIGAQFNPVESYYTDEALNEIDLFAKDMVDMGEQEEYVNHQQLKKAISERLNTLTPRQELVVRLRFGLADMSQVVIPGFEPGERAANFTYAEGLTLEEVGVIMGVARERPRQIEASALRKLKHPSRARVLRRFIREDPKEEEETLVPAKPTTTFAPEKVISEPEKSKELEDWLTLTELATGYGMSREAMQAYIDQYKDRSPKLFRSMGRIQDKNAYIDQYFHKDIISVIEQTESGNTRHVGYDFQKSKTKLHFDTERTVVIREQKVEEEESEFKGWLTLSELAAGFGMSREKIRLLAEAHKEKYPKLFKSIGRIEEKGIYLDQYFHEDLTKIIEEAENAAQENGKEVPKVEKAEEREKEEEIAVTSDWKEMNDLKKEFGREPVDIALLAINFRSTNPDWFKKIKNEKGITVEWYSPELVEELRKKMQ